MADLRCRYLTNRAVPVVRVAHIKYMRITTWGGEPQRTSSFDGDRGVP